MTPSPPPGSSRPAEQQPAPGGEAAASPAGGRPGLKGPGRETFVRRLKDEYEYLRGTQFAGKAVILGALSLYLDFINMFTFLLQFLGNRE